MLKDITLGQYLPGNSPIHRLDPRTKLLWTILYIVAVFMVKSFVGYAFLLAVLLGFTKLAGISIKYLLKGIRPMRFIIILTFVLNVFFSQGQDILWQWKFITITAEGLRNAIFFSLRLMFLVMGTSLMTLTTSPVALTDALERLLSPLRVVRFPVHELAMMMTIALRFIPTLLEETDKIMKAQMARGADFESGNLIKRAQAMVPLLVPLFVSAFQRAGDLAMAMEARCYRGGESRTRLKVLHFSSLDAWAAIFTVVMLALVWLERYLHVLF